jgi:hypothetical protein
MLHLLKRLYELSPAETVRKTRQRLGLVDRDSHRLADILSSSKLRPQRSVDFLSRYETVLSRAMGWKPLDFTGRKIIEIGAGPLLGWGPLAVFRGAESYVCVDPDGGLPVLDDAALRTRYFLPLFRDLTAVYGPRGTFDTFLADVRKRVHVLPRPLLAAGLDRRFDIALSNSCLEHVFDLDESMGYLKSHTSPDFRFIHLVDFGNHRKAASPFSGIYDRLPEEHWARFGRGINLLRPTEILSILQRQWPSQMVPLYPAPEGYNEPILPFWRERHSSEHLFLKVALFASITSTEA